MPVRVDQNAEWNALSGDMRQTLEAGVERINEALESLASSARVQTMPPVVLDPVVYVKDGKPILAGAIKLQSPTGRPQLGVAVSATVALCDDTAKIKSILLHEFCHCFQTATIVMDNEDLGTTITDLTGDQMDEERDNRLLARPSDWFLGPVGDLARWGDAPCVSGERLQALLDEGKLQPSDQPLPSPGMPAIPEDWIAHIRFLRTVSSP